MAVPQDNRVWVDPQMGDPLGGRECGDQGSLTRVRQIEVQAMRPLCLGVRTSLQSMNLSSSGAKVGNSTYISLGCEYYSIC